MRRPTHSSSRVSHERWLVSYADFITLLFALFVVMYAFARAGEQKQAQVSQAITMAFRSMGMSHDYPGEHARREDAHTAGANAATTAQPVMDVQAPIKVRDSLEAVRRALTKTLAAQLADHSVSIGMGRDGLVVSLREAGFFTSGSASPRPGTEAILREIGRSLDATDFDVRVEGHTDNFPVHNAEFDSNWELSAARATRITRLFLELHAIAPDRISAAGYGEYHPVASNATAKGRAQNRRVDLVVMPQTRLDFVSATSRPAEIR